MSFPGADFITWGLSWGDEELRGQSSLAGRACRSSEVTKVQLGEGVMMLQGWLGAKIAFLGTLSLFVLLRLPSLSPCGCLITLTTRSMTFSLPFSTSFLLAAAEIHSLPVLLFSS